MNVLEIKVLLDALAHAQAVHDDALATWPMQAEFAALLSKVEELSKERALYLEHYAEDVSQLEASIQDRVLALGETVKGEQYIAVWSKPRVTWDGKILEGYVIAHPELAAARHVGQPSVSIRPARRYGDG